MGGRGSRSSSGSVGLTVKERMLAESRQLSKLDLAFISDDETDINNRIPWWIRKRELGYGRVSIKRETEKAFLVETDGDYYKGVKGHSAWVAKSVLKTPNEVREEIIQTNARSYGNQLYTHYLVKLALSNGVKLGNTSGWEKVTAKLVKKGISPMSRDEFDNSTYAGTFIAS